MLMVPRCRTYLKNSSMNKHLRTGLVLIFPLLTALQGYCQQLDSIPVVAPGATVQQVSSQFRFTEGPAVNKRGDIYFTEQGQTGLPRTTRIAARARLIATDEAGIADSLGIARRGQFMGGGKNEDALGYFRHRQGRR